MGDLHVTNYVKHVIIEHITRTPMNSSKSSYNLSLLSVGMLALCFGITTIGFIIESTIVFTIGLTLLVTIVPTLVILRVSLFK